jgi:hypothetical protein
MRITNERADTLAISIWEKTSQPIHRIFDL